MKRLLLALCAILLCAGLASAEPMQCRDTTDSGLTVLLDFANSPSRLKTVAIVRNTTERAYRLVQIEVTVFDAAGKYLTLDRGMAKDVPASGEAPFWIGLINARRKSGEIIAASCESETLQAR